MESLGCLSGEEAAITEGGEYSLVGLCEDDYFAGLALQKLSCSATVFGVLPDFEDNRSKVFASISIHGLVRMRFMNLADTYSAYWRFCPILSVYRFKLLPIANPAPAEMKKTRFIPNEVARPTLAIASTC
ncbi:hypothetical protein L7F22_034104 [Adiantum nelumboides]|nr:hypothetical protein [Adiantum nelumboides]